MGPALQSLAIRSAANLVGAATSTAQGAIQDFAEIFSDTSVSPPASGASTSTESGSELEQIHTAIRDHLRQLGLPENESFQIEVGVTGQIQVNSDSANRATIENAILGDKPLLAQIRESAYRQPRGAFPTLVHWPPSAMGTDFRVLSH